MESSSKVTVTYWDPSSVFPLIENDLRAHLPLRNLHWKSPTRPLRSISTLHVELVPYTGNGSPIPHQTPTNGRRGSLTPSVNSGITQGTLTGPTVGGKRRRHQIPGLRNTPYLKLYILRCDDNDQYKSTSRRLLREWVSTHAAASPTATSSGAGGGGSSSSLAPPATSTGSSAKGDVAKQHDASEWLILHVLLPGTAAYAQPRAQAHPVGAQPATRGWAGMKGTTTLLEKIRSDFNTTSKVGIKDRVIQLRIHPNHSDLSLLSPTVPVPPYTLWSSPPEPKEETEAAYQELITKFKTQILSSFDLRVAQYEEDVKERDSQRMLPGWNFCTFFVLKEGLARAFESVGLVEDSLILYDELAVGLQDFLTEEEEKGKGALGIEDWTEETRGWVYKAQDRLRRKLRAQQRRKDEDEEAEGGLTIETDGGSQASTVVGDASDVGDGIAGAVMRRDNSMEGSTTVHETESEFKDADDEEVPELSLSENAPPLSPYKKPYRELILSNRISIFDFECYLFARQSNLLLRLGGATSSMVQTPTVTSASYNWTTYPPEAPSNAPANPLSLQPGEEDLKHLTSLLRRGLTFVTNVGRILRQDLCRGWRRSNPTPEPAWRDQDEEEEKERVIGNLIDDIVKNWMFSVCMQLLEQTEARGIPREVLWGIDSQVNTPPTAGLFPRRTSSLSGTPILEQTGFMVGNVGSRPTSIIISGRGPLALPPERIQTQEQGNPSLEELCAARGDLLILARSLVEGFARRKGWMGEWGSEGKVSSRVKGAMKKKSWFEQVKTPGLQEISLADEGEDEGKNGNADGAREAGLDGFEVGCGIRDKLLRKAVDSEIGFYELFEELSEKARRHFTIGKRVKSGERVVVDLAALKFHLQDYHMAAHYLEKLTTFYEGDGWSLIETNLLSMYAKCLKMLHRREDYVRVLLKLLAKSASTKIKWDWRRIATVANVIPHTPLIDEFRPRGKENDVDVEPSQEEEEAGLDVRGYVSEIISISDKLAQHITSPMNQFFTDILVEPYPRQLGEGRDGYKVLVKFRYLLDEEMSVQMVKVRVVSMVGGLASREIWMASPPSETGEGIRIRRGTQRIWLETNQNIPGTYMVDQIVISAHNISFVHEILGKTTPATPVALTASNAAAAISAAKRNRLHFFPHPESLAVQLRLPETVHLDRGKKVELVITNGWNHVLSAEVGAKSATAGLRMMMREVELLTHAHAPGVDLEDGKVKLKDIPPRTELVLRVPYSAERELGALGVRVEVVYITETGEYTYAVQQTVTVALPLAVNVQDVFKRDVLFSKFQVSTALDIPLVILGARLDGTRTGFITESASPGGEVVGGEGWLVVPRQAGQFVYRIRRRREAKQESSGGALVTAKKPGALQLHITYRSVDEEVVSTVVGVLSRDLKKAGLREYENLLVGHLKERLEQRSIEEMEVWGVVREVGLGGWEGWGWGEVLEGISAGRGGKGGERQRVEAWLKEWWQGEKREGEQGRVVKLGFGGIYGDVNGAGVSRALVIPVEVPAVDVICTVELKLFPNEQAHGSLGYTPERILIAGERVPAELHIQWSREWAIPQQSHRHCHFTHHQATEEEAPAPMEFSYQLIQPPPPPPPTLGMASMSSPAINSAVLGADTWLIAGRRRGTFSIPPYIGSGDKDSEEKEKEGLRLNLILIPLRTGAVPLPGVEIKAITTGRKGDGQDGLGGMGDGVVVETDYVNGGEVVTVGRDVRSVTVAVSGARGEICGEGGNDRASVMGLGLKDE
ncbi:hypothetical protein BGX38DRAFT_1331173 [Terfezia claveryi]|nr:hypothetical protein BGX38DRAFT_1331173 [Terfezia claveryi]